MMFRRREREDEIGPSRGFVKYFHKFMMLLLFPLRKPLWFLAIVLVLYMAPTFRGVKPSEVHSWYWSKIKSSATAASAALGNKTRRYMPDIEMPTFTVTSTGEKAQEPPKVVDMPVKEVRRKIFERAKSAPVAVDILAGRKDQPAPETKVANSAARAKFVAAKPAPELKKAPAAVPPLTAPRKKLALVYVSEAKTLKGPAKVLNANEIRIGTDDIILYGIYVNPRSPKGKEAERYLAGQIGSREVKCVVEAYTYQGVATAICSVGNINLNKSLVEQGYSRNVALD